MYGYYDSNTINAEPIRNRLGLKIKRACQKLLAKLQAKGIQTKLYTLDNEASRLLQDFLTSDGVILQLVAPYVHRRNAAERAIRTFKNHFLAGLASADPALPLDLWDLLLPQATMILNLLRGSRVNPSLSAYAQINGLLDFTKTPLAPPGIRTLVRENPGQRMSWALHAQPGWYVGLAMDHYRCYTVHMTKTKSVRFTDTLTWFPSKVVIPVPTSTDRNIAAANTLTTAILSPSYVSPLAPMDDTTRYYLDVSLEIISSKAHIIFYLSLTHEFNFHLFLACNRFHVTQFLQHNLQLHHA